MAKRKTNAIDAESVMEIATAAPGLIIPSGSTLLDLACTDTTDGFCRAGQGVNSIGDRNAGKTMQAIASMAETFKRYGNHFDYKLLDAENAYCFNTAALFGKKFAAALEIIPIPYDKEWSTQNLALKMLAWMEKKPQFFVIDSMDTLIAEQEYANDAKGDSGGALALRAVANKYLLRRLAGNLPMNGSFLIYLSQAAEAIGKGAMFAPKIRGGGKALGFFAFIEMWLSKGGQIKEGTVKVGDWTIAKIARSKANGKAREVWFPIMPAYGIDDTRANLDWLWSEGVIKPDPPPKDEKAKKVYGTVDGKKKDEEEEKEEEGGRKKKIVPQGYDLRKIGIEYVGKDAALFVETNGLIAKVVEAVKARWDANEKLLVDKTFGGRPSRYE
jgi:RecA/RadA recombinase